MVMMTLPTYVFVESVLTQTNNANWTCGPGTYHMSMSTASANRLKCCEQGGSLQAIKPYLHLTIRPRPSVIRHRTSVLEAILFTDLSLFFRMKAQRLFVSLASIPNDLLSSRGLVSAICPRVRIGSQKRRHSMNLVSRC